MRNDNINKINSGDISQRNDVFQLRNYHVMLAAKVAEIFKVETRQIVQNIKHNSILFPEKYAFQITKEELDNLKSLGMISRSGHGGARSLPWVITRKGAIRLVTLMKAPTAMEAADIFIDVFDEVLVQIYDQKQMIQISNPSRLVADEQHMEQLYNLRKRIMKAMDNLLDIVVDPDLDKTVRDELNDIARGALDNIKEWLRSRRLKNDKVEADTCLILEQVRDMYERRQSELADAKLDRERKVLENFEKRLDILDKLFNMYNQIEPNAFVQLFGKYNQQKLFLPN